MKIVAGSCRRTPLVSQVSCPLAALRGPACPCTCVPCSWLKTLCPGYPGPRAATQLHSAARMPSQPSQSSAQPAQRSQHSRPSCHHPSPTPHALPIHSSTPEHPSPSFRPPLCLPTPDHHLSPRRDPFSFNSLHPTSRHHPPTLISAHSNSEWPAPASPVCVRAPDYRQRPRRHTRTYQHTTLRRPQSGGRLDRSAHVPSLRRTDPYLTHPLPLFPFPTLAREPADIPSSSPPLTTRPATSHRLSPSRHRFSSSSRAALPSSFRDADRVTAPSDSTSSSLCARVQAT